MSRMDDYFNDYLIEHNEYRYVLKLKTKKMLIIALCLIIFIIVFNPLGRIRQAYVDKFTNYASTNINPIKGVISSDENVEDKQEKTYTGKYPKPVEGVITSTYSDSHSGIDIQSENSDGIIAIEKGVVTFAGVQQGYGNSVEVKHYDEKGNVFYSFYAHLDEINVKLGDKLEMFDVIGKQYNKSSEDKNSQNISGHHLHFEIRTAPGYGNDIDPTEYIL